MKFRNIALGLAAAAMCLASPLLKALPVTVNLANNGVGYFNPSVVPAQMDVTLLNHMIGAYNTVANGGTKTILENVSILSGGSSPQNITYTVSAGTTTQTVSAPNAAPGLATASGLLAETSVSGGPTSFDINLGAGGYMYLVAQWDGPNGADTVYYIGGLTGTITLVNDVPDKTRFGLSGYWFSTGGGTSVPDGGTTVSLLGLGLIAIAIVRRKVFHA